ncbi:MAG: hypothetical protein ACI8PB_005347 [Desulforhopalus sp.]|jgi:hypothetical protein
MSIANELTGDMQTLQREVAELKEYKRQKELETEDQVALSDERTDSTESEEALPGSDIGDSEIQNISDQIETFLQNVGEIELERPALTLVAVFTLGAVIGHLLSRR